MIDYLIYLIMHAFFKVVSYSKQNALVSMVEAKHCHKTVLFFCVVAEKLL